MDLNKAESITLFGAIVVILGAYAFFLKVAFQYPTLGLFLSFLGAVLVYLGVFAKRRLENEATKNKVSKTAK